MAGGQSLSGGGLPVSASEIQLFENCQGGNMRMCGSERFEKSIPESGKIEIPFTNDYLVKMFLQKNEQALRSLISAVLHIDPSEIRSLIVENPITPGET